MIIGPKMYAGLHEQFPHMLWLPFMAEASQARWDEMQCWLLEQVGAGGGRHSDLVAETDEWFLGWEGTYPAIYFRSEEAINRFRAYFAISPTFRCVRHEDREEIKIHEPVSRRTATECFHARGF